MKTPKQVQARFKTPYERPRILTYKARELLKKLGPARAHSQGRSLDDELLGIDP